ncbi:Indoleamine 2,3-dioxygenase [Cladophialophora carrionii]|uniref:Indoleamine 2,3-dioxygenase n=1 Tax=Cladophialophora carrionii TaxID=86049 RepID=A0A1C1CU86_9EURO|nr:Indoleamine 2,3-dioxygenase [Cladophialophora carrionii]
MRERLEDFLHRYGVSPRKGFLPDGEPLRRLCDPYYEPWEDLVADLPRHILDERARWKIDELPILDPARLISQAEWRRAYVILGFLTHAYIWGGEEPSERLPPQLTCPFLAVSEHLGLPPTATFSTLSLWNFRLESPDKDPIKAENLRSLLSFTDTGDEEWFYMISTAIEAKGAPLISTMLRCIEAVDANNDCVVLSGLRSITSGIQDIGKLLQRMHERCDPQVFYHNVRPFCAGTKGMAAAGLPRGVFYDQGKGQGQWRQYSGGSNAQSSLIQLFDIFLSVDHNTPGRQEPSQPTSVVARVRAKGYLQVGHAIKRPASGASFQVDSNPLQEMRDYMPKPHRDFLSAVEQSSNVRDYVLTNATTLSAELVAAYNDAVAALANLRNIHIQIVARYIVMPSRSPPAPYIASRKWKNLATACSKKSAEEADGNTSMTRQLHGTGGTSVMPFLKKTRDETARTTIPADCTTRS